MDKRIYWFFEKTGNSSRWQLVLCYDPPLNSPLWLPGYESKHSGDIIEAVMYLNDGYRGRRLTDRTVGILDAIRSEAERLGYLQEGGKGG